MPKRIQIELTQSGSNIRTSGYVDANQINLAQNEDAYIINFLGTGYLREASIRVPKEVAKQLAKELQKARPSSGPFQI